MILTKQAASSGSAHSVGLLLGVSIAWAATAVFIKVAALEVPTATIVTTRTFVAAIALLAWLGPRTLIQAARSADWSSYLAIAITGHVVPFLLMAWAVPGIAIGTAVLLVATTPVFATTIVALARRRWPGRREAVCIALGFAGIVLAVQSSRSVAFDGNKIYHLALLLAAFSYAVSAKFVARISDANSARVTAAVVTCACLIVMPIACIVDRPWVRPPSLASVASLVGLGIISTAAAYVAYYRLVRTAGLVFASLHHYLAPIIGLAMGVLFFDEGVSSQQLMAAILIFASVALGAGLTHQRVREPQ